MTQRINIAGLRCKVAPCPGSARIAYLLYPMELPSEWMIRAARHYGAHIVAISDTDWENDLTPWPAAGVPAGEPRFKGESESFLELLCRQVVPRVERALGFHTEIPGFQDATYDGPYGFAADESVQSDAVHRTLIGVSLAGLFALWQWVECDMFHDIGCVSGSFWYDGFTDWLASRNIPRKTGRAFLLLGDRESRTAVKTFQRVTVETERVVLRLRKAGIQTDFRMVPGDHYANPIPRLELALASLFLIQISNHA